MKKFFQVIAVVVVLYNILAFLLSMLGHSSDSSSSYSYEPGCEEYNRVIAFENDHQREWRIPKETESYCVGYRTSDAINEQEANERSGLINKIDDYDNYWGDAYDELVKQTQDEVDFLADSLRDIANREAMDQLQMAALVVSFVQDIPYSYVLSGDCMDRDTQGKPCLGNIPLGIVSPYEFIHELLGDCDTRAVLLYIMLEHLGYDPMIVVSDEYAHAMLALNVPAQGDYLLHASKKYYFWETTATGWQVGMLPPDTNNKEYWEIALVNES